MRYLLGRAVSGNTTALDAGITIFLHCFLAWKSGVQTDAKAGAKGTFAG
jgi:hypothetical protein